MNTQEASAVAARYDSSQYPRYADITAYLQAWSTLHPGLCRLESVGRSPEGREIWSMTLTNFATGEDRSKPAYHINGQHHAGEITAGATALYTVQYLLSHYGTDPAVTELLDTRAVYVLPRIAVDGAEWYFENPQMLRSSPLLYPEPEEPEGLRPTDINGDGMILQMRIAHPQGDWKVSALDPRMMVRRRPDDREGTFYRLYTEGIIKQRTPSGRVEQSWDGRAIGPDAGGPYARERSLDFNRNYPTNWKPQYRMAGSGRYPFDRPELRAMVDFWLQHPNIGGAMSYHTRSGMNLRPSALVGDEKVNESDLEMYKRIGEVCTRLTGYPTVSVYEYFTYDYNPDRLDVGSWLEWCYDEKGVQGFEMELWDFPYLCGVPKRPLKELRSLSDEKREEEALLTLQWNDREMNGKGFIPWHAFEHEQLGTVELGGWDPKYMGQNPPTVLLHQECHKACLFTVEHALSLPLLRIGEVRVQALGGRNFRVAAEVVNRGFLPSHVTQAAVDMKATKPVAVTIIGDVRVVGGQVRQEVGQIHGRGSGFNPLWGGASSPVISAWAEWVVQGDPGGRVQVVVNHDRGGTASREVTL